MLILSKKKKEDENKKQVEAINQYECLSVSEAKMMIFWSMHEVVDNLIADDDDGDGIVSTLESPRRDQTIMRLNKILI